MKNLLICICISAIAISGHVIQSNMSTYTTKAGDTLWGLSQQYGIPLGQILAANSGIEPENLQIGQRVNLPTKGLAQSHDRKSSVSDRTITSIVTSYGWDDNDPPSAEIAYPKNAGYPTKHDLAIEGQGTYDDPITFATDKRELAVGTMIYVPFLQKYFIMEDDCVAAHADWDQGKHHVDLWMGPQHESDQGRLSNCEDKITRSAANVIIDPSRDLPVDRTSLFSDNQCTARIHD